MKIIIYSKDIIYYEYYYILFDVINLISEISYRNLEFCLEFLIKENYILQRKYNHPFKIIGKEIKYKYY